VVSFFILHPSALGQGALTPPGAPAPTMKTLEQIEPRTPISTAPFTISQSGSYYLTTNLTVGGGNAITVAADGVTLDLNGFTIRSTANPAAGFAVLINSGLRNITIQNGVIQGAVTNSAGIFSGSGFDYGIRYTGTAPQNVRVIGVSVSGCHYDAINVGNAESTLVENCVVRTVGGTGISASSIRGCVAAECGGRGIQGNQVSDSRGESVVSGEGVYAITAQNCYGFSNSGIAGLYDLNAAFCVGSRSSGTAIQATIANGCWASSGTNPITHKYNMP
jgi:hypothetical protein